MVHSTLNQQLNYDEHRKEGVLDNDKGHEATLYKISLFDDLYTIALGQQNTEFVEKYNIVYYPIYLLKSSSEVQGMIGVYEIDSESSITVVDDDGDAQLDKLAGPVLFSFVNEKYIKNAYRGESLTVDDSVTPEYDIDKEESVEEVDVVVEHDEDKSEDKNEENDEDTDNDEDNNDYENEEDRELYESPTPPNLDNYHADSTDPTSQDDSTIYTKDTVFTKNDPLPLVEPLPLETQKDSEAIHKSYKKQPKGGKNNWINNLLKNPYYKIIPVRGDGSCYFHAITKGFETIGYKTSSTILRAFLAQNIQEVHYRNYKTLYDALVLNQTEIELEKKDLKGKSESLRKENDSARTIDLQKEIIDEAKRVKDNYDVAQLESASNDEVLGELSFMKNIHSLNDLRNYVKGKDFWADDITIAILQDSLNIRTIIVEESTSRKNMVKFSEVLQSTKPDYYLILEYKDGNHYDLVTYKDKAVFQFDELPFTLKKTIIDIYKPEIKNGKVVPNNIYKIDDFKRFFMELYKKSPEEVAVELQNQENESQSNKDIPTDLFDETVQLMFYGNADKSKKVGKIIHDVVPKNKIKDYAPLDTIGKLWRRRLDDSWVKCESKKNEKINTKEVYCGNEELMAPFTSKNKKKWASVQHYLTALPYEKDDPDFYNKLSMDSNSSMSENIKLMEEAVKKRSSKSTIENREDFRKEALMLKFSQNLDLKDILLKTRNAKLVHYSPSKIEPDISMMEVRKELSTIP